jgi:hypothetical protein
MQKEILLMMHPWVLQDTDSKLDPEHVKPPFVGEGLVQVLVLV